MQGTTQIAPDFAKLIIGRRIRATPWLIRSYGTQPRQAQKFDVVFFSANFRRYRRTKSASLPGAREFVSSISGDELKPNRVRLREDSLRPDNAAEPDLEALQTAKARQDISHQKLDEWIAAAIAELSDRKRAA